MVQGVNIYYPRPSVLKIANCCCNRSDEGVINISVHSKQNQITLG